MASLYAMIPSIPAGIYPYVGGIALVMGLLLAFFGESVFKMITSVIGAILGSILGFAFGASLGGVLGSFIVAFIGAVIGGILFFYVAEAGLALLIAYFAFTGILHLFGASGSVSSISAQPSLAQIAALIAGFAVFMLSIIFFTDIVAVITAVAGGIMVDYGLTYLNFGTTGTIISVVVIVLGMVYQFTRIRARKSMKDKIIGEKIYGPPSSGTEE